MSHHVVNQLVNSSQPNVSESLKTDSVQLKDAPFLCQAKQALHQIEKQHLTSEMGDPESSKGGEDGAIGYGFLVEAKLALYKLQNEYTKLQELEAQINQQMYKLTNHLAKGVSEETYAGLSEEAKQMRADAYGSFASAAGQIGLAGGYQLYKTRGLSNREAVLRKDNASLEEMDNIYSSPRQARTAATNRPEEEIQAEEKERINNRPQTITDQIKNRTEGEFPREKDPNSPEGANKDENKKKIKSKIEFKKETEQEIRELASDEECQEIKNKIRSLEDKNERELDDISRERLRVSNQVQFFSTIISNISQGGAAMAKASEKDVEAAHKANQAALQTSQSMISPGDAFKAMDGFQQDALNVLKIIEAIEQANRYQPGR